MAATSGAVPLIGQAQPQASAEEARNIPVRWAAVIFQDRDGQVVCTNDPRFVNSDVLNIEKTAHPDEILGAVWVVSNDIAAQRTAIENHQMMQAAARAAMEQQRNMAILNQMQQNTGKK